MQERKVLSLADRKQQPTRYPVCFMKYNLKYRKGEMKDYPVLYTAIIEEVDLLVTGDKDFSDIDIEKPEIMSPSTVYGKIFIRSLSSV